MCLMLMSRWSILKTDSMHRTETSFTDFAGDIQPVIASNGNSALSMSTTR